MFIAFIVELIGLFSLAGRYSRVSIYYYYYYAEVTWAKRLESVGKHPQRRSRDAG